MHSINNFIPAYTYNLLTGKLVSTLNQSQSLVKKIFGSMVGLHRGAYADLPGRIMFFILGVLATMMIGSGMILWTVKRRKKYKEPDRHFGLRLMETINVGTIAGLLLATVTFFLTNRLLPLNFPDRQDLEVNIFFTVWLCCYIFPFGINKRLAWRFILLTAGCICLILPLISQISYQGGFWQSWQQGHWLFIAFDFFFIMLGILLPVVAYHYFRGKG